MSNPKGASWRARVVHWFRYRFDIGYRIELEFCKRDRQRSARWLSVAGYCPNVGDKGAVQDARMRSERNSELFDGIMRELSSVE